MQLITFGCLLVYLGGQLKCFVEVVLIAFAYSQYLISLIESSFYLLFNFAQDLSTLTYDFLTFDGCPRIVH